MLETGDKTCYTLRNFEGGGMDKEQVLQQTLQALTERAVGRNLVSDVALSFNQMQDLANLNAYCVSQMLGDEEVQRDPRKLSYKSNQELQLALQAICLSQSLIRPNRSYKENREFFSSNITVMTLEDGTKSVSFGAVAPDLVQQAIYTGIVEDWKIYRDREGMKIKSLVDVKTNFTGLSGYMRGGNCVQEFARFNRKFYEKEKAKEERAREYMQNAMRGAVVQNLFAKMTDQMLAQGKSPQEIMNALLDNLEYVPGKELSGRRPQQQIDSRVEEQISLMLEDKSNERPR